MSDIKAVIGIDQSYKRTGISICINGNISYINSISPDPSSVPSEKRLYIVNNIYQLIYDVIKREHLDPQNTIVVFEKIRQFSKGFISINYIVETGALISCIADLFRSKGYECYCVDTRAWKSNVIGTSKPEDNKYGIQPSKWPTIKYVKNQLKDNTVILIEENKKKKGTIKIKGKYYSINDDACDAACIAQFYFKTKNPMKLLKKVEF